MRSLVAGLVLGLLVASLAAADNIPFENGRLAAGPVTVLAITSEQVLTIRTNRVAVLTRKQKAKLRKEAGIAPSVLEVHTIKGAELGIHGCFAYNFAVWFAPDRIEVPHEYLLSDEDAAKKADEMDDSGE